MPGHDEAGILASFAELDAAVAAIEKVRTERLGRMVVYTPVPRHELDHALHEPESAVRLYTLVGGLTGAATGFALTTWTSLDWPLMTGGKPIISLPPFVVIAFELTILFGALSTVLGLLVNAHLPRFRFEVVYDPAFSAGQFGIFVTPAPGKRTDARAALQEAGALEIRENAEEVDVATR